MSCENCYCPIYKQECERFGGTPKYLHTRVDIVKDCSECVLPHKENFKEIICEPNKKML